MNVGWLRCPADPAFKLQTDSQATPHCLTYSWCLDTQMTGDHAKLCSILHEHSTVTWTPVVTLMLMLQSYELSNLSERTASCQISETISICDASKDWQCSSYATLD